MNYTEEEELLKISQELKKVVAKTLNLPLSEITPELAAGEVERWDSLGHLNLILAIEGNFKIKFKTEQIPKLTTVEKIQEQIKARGLFNE